MLDSGNCNEDFSVQNTVIFEGEKNESEMISRQSLENIQIGCSFASELVTEDGQTDSLPIQSTSSYITPSKNEFMESRNFLLDSQRNLPHKDNYDLTESESWKGNENIYINFVDEMAGEDSFLNSAEGVSQALTTIVPVGPYEDAKEGTSSVFSNQFVINPTFEDFHVSEESDYSAQSQVINKASRSYPQMRLPGTC